MLNVKIECDGLLSGEGKICTDSCWKAIEKFQADSIGKYFLDCSCERDAECLTYQARAKRCYKNQMIPKKIGCATFSRKCVNNTVCMSNMEKFYIKCTHLISGTECTQTCEKVQELVYSNNITKGLLNCECSGTVKEENFCRGIRAHTFYLCKTSPLLKKIEAKPPKGEGGFGVTIAKDVDSAGQKLNGSEILLSFMLLMLTLLARGV